MPLTSIPLVLVQVLRLSRKCITDHYWKDFGIYSGCVIDSTLRLDYVFHQLSNACLSPALVLRREVSARCCLD